MKAKLFSCLQETGEILGRSYLCHGKHRGESGNDLCCWMLPLLYMGGRCSYLSVPKFLDQTLRSGCLGLLERRSLNNPYKKNGLYLTLCRTAILRCHICNWCQCHGDPTELQVRSKVRVVMKKEKDEFMKLFPV